MRKSFLNKVWMSIENGFFYASLNLQPIEFLRLITNLSHVEDEAIIGLVVPFTKKVF